MRTIIAGSVERKWSDEFSLAYGAVSREWMKYQYGEATALWIENPNGETACLPPELDVLSPYKVWNYFFNMTMRVCYCSGLNAGVVTLRRK